jgi:S-formylglutathione hydrolase FrmB
MSARGLAVVMFLAPLAPVAAVAQPPAEKIEVKTVAFEAKSVGRTLKYNIVLPADYEKSDRRYPVLYLLHGYSGNYRNWAGMNAPKYARQHELIVVMPDAGNSWYVNWAKSDEGQKNAWDDCITKDLVCHVDSTYRTIARREGRAINGLSMGGYGALMLGLKHPDLFCSIGSHSGAVAFAKGAAERMRQGGEATKKKGSRTPSDTPNPSIGIEGFSSQAERSPKGKAFTTAEEAEAYDPFKLVLAVPKDSLPHIYIDCGTDDGLVRSNQDLVKVLMEHKIPFTYAESPGGHNGAYWSREVGHSMAVQAHILRRSLAGKAAADSPGSK